MRWVMAIVVLAAVASAEPVSEGRLEVFLHCAIDLDAGQCVCMVVLDGNGTEPPGHPSGKKFDLRLEPRGRHLYFEPRNGASLGEPTQSRSDFKGCMGAQYSKRRREIDGLSEGNYICARTAEGRYAELRVEKSIVAEADRAFFTYATWGKEP